MPTYSLPRRTRFAVLAGAACIALGSVLFAAHYSRAEPAPPASPPGLAFAKDNVTVGTDAPAWSALEIGSPKPAKALWTDSIPARVAFDEARTSRVGSPLAGRIASVLVESGQNVKAGTPLFTVTSSGLAEMHADAAKAALELKTAQIELDRTKALVDVGSLPAKELVSATQKLAEAQMAGQLAAQKLSSLAGKQSGGSTITIMAPRDGVVVEKHVAPGQQVDASTGDLVAIADLSSVWVVADLFETDATGVVPGAAAQVSVDEGATQIPATVTQVASIVDPDRHTVPVRIELANADGALRPNAHAQVRLRTRSERAVLVPAGAVLSDGATNYVYIAAAGGVMARRDVTVGTATDGQVPVLSGLRLDEKVVTKGGVLLDNAIQLHDE
ncbi:MAG TPA: efflux RND transporter periplasmic adaptor subunit [Kofleriaceae bacterium]|jgi:RND family efflux transporter MFP subunit